MDTSDVMEFQTPRDDFLTYPRHKVIALLDDSDSVRGAISELIHAGFDKDQIDVLVGSDAARRLDVEGRHHGLKGRIYRMIERLGDLPDWLERHSRHIEQGGFGVSVAADKKRWSEAAIILGKNGGHDGAYFGTAHWQPILRS